MSSLLLIAVLGVQWQHPAGLVTQETLGEVREKTATQSWAQAVYGSRREALAAWLELPYDELKRVFPTRCGNVYHNFSCPADRSRLTFDPFNPDKFACPVCGGAYEPETDPGVYKPEDRYHGTMYDGWACIFYQQAGTVAHDLGLVALLEEKPDYARRAVEILMLYADTIEGLPTQFQDDRQFSRILTYHREGDNKILYDMACAYELVRDAMSPEQRARFERVALTRMLDDIMLEPVYTYRHNNVYQWHRTVVQAALALEREDLVDWSFGYGAYSPETAPEHRSMRRILQTDFLPDGAYWELCSGYHLYPVHHLCEFAVVSRNLSRMDPERFPADLYDLTAASNPDGAKIKAALEWFMSVAMPDRTMTILGDSPTPRAGMDDYFATAEIGYRFFDVKAVGDYPALREGKRSWDALLYGAPVIAQHPTPFTSSFLSSGWVSLRNEWQGNRVWVGLNALIAGGGHQHADRLTFTMYSQETLLALEKGTPYNENVTRTLGTLTPMHNTVVVDGVSQKQGESLAPEETPEVALFFASPLVQFAQLRADAFYPPATTYRRSVALIEDVAVDFFEVDGGTRHDWMLHHAGARPETAVAMESGTFEPKDWLYNGTDSVLHGRTDDAFSVRWQLGDAVSHLALCGAPGTEVFALETYPIDNAVITPNNPPCQTLCVRRTNSRAPFLAVWNATRGGANPVGVAWGDDGRSVSLAAATGARYVILFGGGTAKSDGYTMSSDATFVAARIGEKGCDAVAFASGTFCEVIDAGHALRVAVTPRDADGGPVRASVCAEFAPDAEPVITVAGDIHYDTYGGEDHLRPAPEVDVTVTR